MSQVSVDREEILRFFSLLFPIHPWPGSINVDFRQGRNMRERFAFPDLKAIHMANFNLWSQYQSEGFGIIYTPSFMKVDGKNTKQNVIAVQNLFADIDYVDDTKLQELLLHSPLRPTLVIRSGNGVHFYWQLTEISYEVQDRGPVETALKLVHSWVGGDKTHNKNRLLRVGGSYNVNPEKYGDVPPKCKILEYNEIRYTLEDVLKNKISYMGIRVRENFKEKYILNGDGPKRKNNPDEVDRSARDFLIVKEMGEAGHTPEEITAVLTNPRWGCSDKALAEGSWEEYVKETLKHGLSAAQSTKVGCSVFDDPTKGIIRRKRVRKDGFIDEESISNFCIVPQQVLVIYDQTKPVAEWLDCEVRSEVGRTRKCRLSTADLQDTRSVLQAAQMALCQYWGDTKEYAQYISYLSKQEVPVGMGTHIMGWHGNSFVMPYATLTGDPMEYVDPGMSVHAVYENQKWEFSKSTVRELAEHVYGLHNQEASVLTFGWMLASAFAPHIRAKYYDQFPILHLHGDMGCGKTSLARTFIQSMYGQMDECSSETTHPVLLRRLNYSNAVPLLIDEFNNNPKNVEEWNNMFRLLWQAGYAQRMRMGMKHESVNALKLQCPTVVTSMVGISDDASIDRCINLRIHKPNFDRTMAHYEWFNSLPKAGILAEWITHDPTSWIERIKRIGNLLTKKTTRQQHAFACVFAPLEYLSEKYGVPDFSLDRLFDLLHERTQADEADSPMKIVDRVLAYMIRHFRLHPLTGYYVQGDTLKLVQATFTDQFIMDHRNLRLAYPIDKKWIIRTLKDGISTGEVKAVSKTIRIPNCESPVSGTEISLDKFPLTKEALALVTANKSPVGPLGE